MELAPSVPPQLQALVAPDVGMERVARLGRARWPLLFAILCSLLAGGAAALRVDARDATLRQLETSGQLKTMSDRQIDDQQKNDERAFIVKRLALATVKPPLIYFGSAVALLILGWFFRGRARGRAVLAVAAASLLPGAVANILEAVATMRQWSIAPETERLVPATLTKLLEVAGHPLVGPWAKLGGALDFFSLWAALMLAFGLPFVAGIPRRRAVLGTLAAWLLWRLVTQVAFGG